MAKNYYDITLAMAGISQTARLVQQLAHEGQCDREAMNISLSSLLQMDPLPRWRCLAVKNAI
ncbi:High frequency lysogenization protein HflD [Serratia quinivorans]|nr:High frequency lysogenization protein HflD [Serratia quinivorans]